MENIPQTPELDIPSQKESQAQLIVLIWNRVHILLTMENKVTNGILLNLQNITQIMLHISLLTTDSPEQILMKKLLCSLIFELWKEYWDREIVMLGDKLTKIS